MRDGMKLSRRKAIFVYAWFVFLLVVGAFLIVNQLLTEDFLQSQTNIKVAFITALGGALAANALSYIRRLYKDIFQQGLREPQDPSSSAELATIMYFLSRPLFAVLLTLVVLISTVTFVHTVTQPGVQLSAGFTLFVTLISAYGSFAIGGAISRFEKVALEKLQSIGGGL